MADIEITSDSTDLKDIINSLGSLKSEFAKTVSTIERENKRLENASRASKATILQALDAMELKQTTTEMKRQLAEQERNLKSSSKMWQEYYKSLGGMSGKGAPTSASDSVLVKQLKEQQAEEDRIQKLSLTSWKEYFQQKNSLASSAGAPATASQSALIQMLKDEEQQARITAIAEEERLKAIQRLETQFNRSAAAQRKYNTLVSELATAQKLGVINSQQYEAQLERLNAELAAFNNKQYIAGSRFNQFGEMSEFAGKKMSRFSMYTQQAGYQVGDFFIQVASGQNAMVALTQQGTQLVSMFGAVGAAIGAVLAIGGALYMVWDKSNEATKKAAEEQSKSIDQIVKKIQEYQKEVSAAASGKSLDESLLSGGIDSLVKKIDTLKERINILNSTTLQGFWLRGFTSSGLEANKLNEAIKERIQLERQLQQLQDMQAAKAEENLTSLRSQAELNRVENLYGKESVEYLTQLEAILERKLYAEATSLGYTKEQRDEYVALGLEAERHKKAVEDSNTALDQSKKYYDSLLEVQKAHTDKIQEAEGYAKGFAGVDLVSGVDKAAQAAKELATQMGVSYSYALGMIKARNEMLDSAVGTGGAGPTPNVPETPTLDEYPTANAPKTSVRPKSAPDSWNGLTSSDILDKITADSVKKSKSGGSSKRRQKTEDDIIKQIETEIEQKKRLISLSGEQYTLTQYIIDIENQLGNKRKNITDAQIKDLAERQMELDKQRELRETLDNIFTSNIENGMMALVEGSKSVEDAFKSMISSIISDIYQQMVAKQAASYVSNSILGFLGMANGGAFLGGQNLTKYASGGVVTAPTNFLHSGGVGLMGEAGPEAIMPLKRGSDGKLGVSVDSSQSQGNVVVQQNFNISANGDDTVKRIIQQQTPKIAEQAKLAVLDAKRRNKPGY